MSDEGGPIRDNYRAPAQMGRGQNSPSYSTLILCKGKRVLVVEYALRNLATPMGIAEFRHLEKLPAELMGSLPSIEEIEAELGSSSADGE